MYDANELRLIRVALDTVTIQGADAKFLAQLQIKTEQSIEELSKSTPKSKPSPK